MKDNLKVALVHYWLLNMRGGEKVLEALCDLFPEADIYTLLVDESILTEKLKRHRIIPSFVQKIPGAKKHYKNLLPLYPLALEQFDLSGYDLVISSESGPAKGVLTRPETCHICYCHTPMRYLWDMYHNYLAEAGWTKKLLMPVAAQYLRSWDLQSAQRVDYFVANSEHVARRIAKHYKREAEIIYPPVSTGSFSVSDETGDYYLYAGQLVGYKRPDLAVDAFTQLGKPLVVIGEGQEMPMLKKKAGPNIRFLGRQPDEVMKDYFARCRALIFPGEEDFGIIPVEVQAAGRPVIAYACGGALETVLPGKTGLFFKEQTVESLLQAVAAFEETESEMAPENIRQHSLVFDHSRFLEQMKEFIDKKLATHRSLFGSDQVF